VPYFVQGGQDLSPRMATSFYIKKELLLIYFSYEGASVLLNINPIKF